LPWERLRGGVERVGLKDDDEGAARVGLKDDDKGAALGAEVGPRVPNVNEDASAYAVHCGALKVLILGASAMSSLPAASKKCP